MMDVERPSLCNCVVNFLLEEKYHLTAFELLHELLEDGRHDQAIRLRDSDRQIQLPQRNIVSTVNLDFKLDLKSIALQARNAEYNPKEGNRRKCNEEKKAVVLTYIGRCCVHLSLHRSSVNPTFTSADFRIFSSLKLAKSEGRISHLPSNSGMNMKEGEGLMWNWIVSVGARELTRFMRHPSYCGFFIWATGTQLMICNPICALGFTAITWRFFSSRIVYEEFFWKRFFGAHYVEYAQRIPSGLPFIA